MLFAVFVTFSRIPELFYIMTGIYVPYLIVILQILGFAVAVINGDLFRVFASSVWFHLCVFTVWLFVCTPFGVYKAASLGTIIHSWLPTMVGFILTAGLIRNMKELRYVMMALAVSSTLIAVGSKRMGTMIENRLSYQTGTLGNANDLASILLIGLPFCVLPFLHKSSGFKRSLALISIALVALAVAWTGSRGGFLDVLVIVLTLLVMLPARGKLFLVVFG